MLQDDWQHQARHPIAPPCRNITQAGQSSMRDIKRRSKASKKVKIKLDVIENPCQDKSLSQKNEKTPKSAKITKNIKQPPTTNTANISPAQSQMSNTLPRTIISLPTQLTTNSLPRSPKPPRKLSGYVSPATSLRKPSKIDMFKEQCKGLNIKKLENLPDVLIKSAKKL